MAGVGEQQYVNGQWMDMYTPAWTAAMQANQLGTAQRTGQMAGTETAAFNQAAGIPSLSGLLGGLTGSSSAAGGAGGAGSTGAPGSISTGIPSTGVAGGGAGGGGVAPMQTPDMTAANKAAYNTAKDTVGKTGQSALSGFRDTLAGRGLLGSGIEAQGTEQLAESGAGQLGQVTRDQATKAADLAQQTGLANYQGEIAQQGQQLSAATAQRGQDIQAQEAAATRNQNVLLGLLNAFKPSGGSSSAGVVY